MNHVKTRLICTIFILSLLPLVAQAKVFVTNSFNDQVDANPGDGVCQTVSGVCSLRAAVQESNALTGHDEIILSIGAYPLTIAGRDEDASAKGDLDVLDDITIRGQGAQKTIIDASIIDRVFEVRNATVNFHDLSITGGLVRIRDNTGALQSGGMGGGILSYVSTINLDNVWIYSNAAAGMGGGLFALLSVVNSQHSIFYRNVSGSGAGLALVTSNTTLTDSFVLYHPSADISTSTTINGSGAFLGAGIYNWGNLTIDNSVFYQNTAEIDGGAIYHGLGNLRISNTTISNNLAKRNGGAIYYRMGEPGGLSVPTEPVLRNVSIVNNIALSSDKTGATGDQLFGFTPDPSTFPAFPDNNFDIGTIDFAIPEGDSEGPIGGGGVFVVGQFGQGQAKVSLTVVNSIIANNYRNAARTDADNCKNTADGQMHSLGHNVDTDGSCNLVNSTDLASNLDLKLIPFSITNIVHSSSLFYPPNLTQSQFNKLIPHTQLIEADSPLRDNGNDALCPDDDQRGQTRPVTGCDIGAYEFLPPVASPMQYVARPGVAFDSVFIISDPAGKAVTYEVVTQPAQGVVTQPLGTSNSSWRFTANANASGNDQFTYRVCFVGLTDECSSVATIGVNILSESTVTDTVSVNVLNEVSANVSTVDIVNEANLIKDLEDIDYKFPVGVLFFSVENIPVNASDSLVVEIQLPANTDIPEDAVVRKLDNTGEWRTLGNAPSPSESTAVIDPFNKTITLTLLDDDIFDSNPTPGIIRDPIALAVPESEEKSSSGGGGAMAALPLLLLLLLGLGSRIRITRRR